MQEFSYSQLAAAVLLQAVRDARSSVPGVCGPARLWLEDHGQLWADALGVGDAFEKWAGSGCPETGRGFIQRGRKRVANER